MEETKVTPSQVRASERQSVRLGEQLVKRGIISPDKLREALAARVERFGGKPLADVLVDLGMASRKDTLAAQASILGVPFASLSTRLVRPGAIDALPREFCNANNILPLACADGWITVASSDITNIFVVEQIQKHSGKQVQLVAAEGANLRRTRDELYQNSRPEGASAANDGEVTGLDQLDLQELTVLTTEVRKAEEQSADLEAQADGSPIIRLVNHIIRAAVNAGASDIHIEPEVSDFGIRYRIDGELTCEAMRPSSRLLPAVVSRIKIMAGLDISERRMPQDGAIVVMIAEHRIELRVSTMATTFGEKVVMRVADNSLGVRTLDELGFPSALLAGFRKCLNRPNGIVLVTGPTGSGKSTTLYGALAEIVTPRMNISSIEDPVEYHLEGINQFQVNAKTNFTFAKALRSMLRQDPDIIMVGEIRDSETAKLATEAALTGHLVLSTLHTNDAVGAIPRLVNMGVEPYLVAASLRGVLAQRLVKKLCTHCRRKTPLPPALRQMLIERTGNLPFDSLDHGAGCDHCRGTGSRGRTGVYELLQTDEEMLHDLAKNPSPQLLRERAKARGLTTLLDDTIEKLGKGIVGVEALHDIMGHVDAIETPAAQPPMAA
jgi:type IV pilus assembly protein PilB